MNLTRTLFGGNLQFGKEIIAGSLSHDGRNSNGNCSAVLVGENCWLSPESEQIIIGRVQTQHAGTLAVLDTCSDGLQEGILVGSCLVEMEATVPIRVLNVRDKKIRLLKGNEVHTLPTCTGGKPETGNLRQAFPTTAKENIPAHLAELIDTSSKKITASQKQDLTNLFGTYQDVFSKLGLSLL
jgi:hypothetical protein